MPHEPTQWIQEEIAVKSVHYIIRAQSTDTGLGGAERQPVDANIEEDDHYVAGRPPLIYSYSTIEAYLAVIDWCYRCERYPGVFTHNIDI